MSFHIAIMSVAIEASRLTCLCFPGFVLVLSSMSFGFGDRKSRVISVLGERRASNHVGVVEVRVK